MLARSVTSIIDPVRRAPTFLTTSDLVAVLLVAAASRARNVADRQRPGPARPSA